MGYLVLTNCRRYNARYIYGVDSPDTGYQTEAREEATECESLVEARQLNELAFKGMGSIVRSDLDLNVSYCFVRFGE